MLNVYSVYLELNEIQCIYNTFRDSHLERPLVEIPGAPLRPGRGVPYAGRPEFIFGAVHVSMSVHTWAHGGG